MAEEAALIAKSRAGDAEAFGRLVRRYEDRIYTLARSVCAGLPAEAEDVYQETFLTAFKKIRGFRGDSGLGTWLHRIAANLCWMRHRKKKSEPFVPMLDEPESPPTSIVLPVELVVRESCGGELLRQDAPYARAVG